jgi:hypothetical protein
MRVYKFEVMVIDFDGLSMEETRREMECARFPNDCIHLQVMDSASAVIEWNDNHPLNKNNTHFQAYRELFAAPKGGE